MVVYYTRYLMYCMELIAFISSVAYNENYKNQGKFLNIFPYFMGILFFSEITAQLGVYQFLTLNVAFFSSFQVLFQVLFYIIIIGQNSNNRIKQLSGFLFIINLVFFFYEVLKMGSPYFFLDKSYMLGSITIIVLSLLYLVQIVQVRNETGILSNVLFWVCLGLFLGFTIDICITSLTNMLWDLENMELVISNVLQIIRFLFFSMTYLLFAIGFKKAKWNGSIY